MNQQIGIGMLGCGTVGRSVAEILCRDAEKLTARTGQSLELRRVAIRDCNKDRGDSLPLRICTNDARSVVADPTVQIIVEVMGGIDPAKELILAALAGGKNVVTANKALLAIHGRELFAAARAAGRCIAFEGAVAGGVPLIEAIRRGLVANRIDRVLGILNGTCNFILTRMLENNASYAHALAEAQRLGYAEADPSLDVDGVDSAHKLTLLASLSLRQGCEFERVSIAGISKIELIDLTAGLELGYICKLIASARRNPDGIELGVHPMFVPRAHPLANVGGPFNAVSVYGSAVGHVFFYGRGAGGMATASAVVADIVDVALGNASRTFENLVMLPDQTGPAVFRDGGRTVSPFYLRLELEDKPGGIGRVATLLGDEGISIATITQHMPSQTALNGGVPVVVTTQPAARASVDAALSKIERSSGVKGPPVCIPVLDEVGG